MKTILSRYETGGMLLLYILDTETENIGFTIIPQTLQDQFTLNGDWRVESLIQLKRIGDNYPIGFSNGHTMRNSGTCGRMKYTKQTSEEIEGHHTITTYLRSAELEGRHKVSYYEGDESVTIQTEIENTGKKEERLEMLSSFSLCSLFGFTEEARTGDFLLHRLRSKWSEEGRLETRNFLDLQLEPSWQVYGAQSIRYGQVGSMPVRRFFPWFMVEDTKYRCIIGGGLAIPSSWQMEIFSEDNRPAVSGGIADREFGQWVKALKPGEVFITPKAELTCCKGSLDEACARLTGRQRENLEHIPAVEKDMPVIFNEFCTTWGKPTEERMEKIASRLEGKGITYCVIDAGWHADSERGWESNMGDWVPSLDNFPHGLKAVADSIRAHGMIPGLWFEPETCGKDADIYQKEEMLLTRDGFPITTDRRRFLDMRKKAVIRHLDKQLINCLKENGFGYLKVDYNDNIGLGCDGEESLGENLRQHMECSREFYRKIRRELPDLVMENCSSGGHRLEESMMELFSMASFSDAHECVSGPIIAANLHRAILPAQSQIWAVLRADAEDKRLRYVLAGTFLGRMCLSGDVDLLSEKQWNLVDGCIRFYRKCAPVIRNGISFRYGPEVLSYAHPAGYQMLARVAGNTAIIVVHTFERNRTGEIQQEIPTLEGFEIVDSWGSEYVEYRMEKDGNLYINRMEDFDGLVLLLGNRSKAAGPELYKI